MFRHTLHALSIAASLALLTACGGGQPSPADQPATAASSEGLLIGMIDHALDKASAQLAANNLTLSSNQGNAPKAAITPQGDLLIDGKAVPITPAQRSELLAYRKQVVQLAQDGMELGKQGAKLGINAASTAIMGMLSGQSDEQVEQQVKAKASAMRKTAESLCKRLPAMLQSQIKLATDLPAFQPYADMTQSDIEECQQNLHKQNG